MVSRTLEFSIRKWTFLSIGSTLLMWSIALSAAVSSAGDDLPPQLRAPITESDLGIVSTGNPEATRAAVDVLERGGNAIDAAVAASLVLSVADSDASGIGGATYMLIKPAGRPAVVIDGTSITPAQVDVDRLRAVKLTGRNFGHEMVSVPSTLAVLDLALRRHGTIGMAEALQPAIAVAETGYALSPIQITWTRDYYDNILKASVYAPYLVMEDGHTIGEPGDRHCQPNLAKTLRRIAAEGVDSFYRGTIADEIEADMIANGGFLRKADLVMFKVRERPPVSTTYRGVEVLTVPSPGGGETLIEVLNILEAFPSDFIAGDSLERHHTLVEAFRIAIADRGGSANPMLGGSSGSRIMSKSHARTRAAMIVPGRVLKRSEISGPVDLDCFPKGESTTQVSVIDQWGNIVSLIQTLSRSFGAKVVTPNLGFFYNSFLESFSVEKPQCGGQLLPRSPCISDMAPTIVLRDDQPIAVLGTPGSNRIPGIIATVISNIVDRGMTLRDAVTAPRIVWGGYTRMRVSVEMAPPFTAANMDALLDMGYHEIERFDFPAQPIQLTRPGGVNAVAFDPATGVYSGIADPRRGGLAMGPRVVVANE